MKFHYLIAAIVLGGFSMPSISKAQVAGRPSASVPTLMIEMRPSEKRPLRLKPNERNPYARRAPSQEAVNDNGENIEELQIRERLSNLSVTGQSVGPNGLRLLLGDIILEQGQILPQLIQNQSESLRVIEVTENSVTLGWLDIETRELTGKTMQMSYDLTPVVSFALQGQPRDEAEGPASRVMGVMRPNDETIRKASGMASNEGDDDN